MKEYERIGKGKICLPNYRDKEVTSDNFERCVKLSNLPWTVDKEKIINFFLGFTLPPSDISIQVNREGRKNGYAICILESREEALRAIRDLHKKEITAPATMY